MKKHFHHFVPLFLLSVMLFGSHSLSAEDDLTARVNRLERMLDGGALVDIVNEMEALRRDVQQLRGDMEQQNYNLEQMEKRQQNIFDDLDTRLQALESGKTGDEPVGEDDEVKDVTQLDDQTNEQIDDQAKDASGSAIDNASAIVPVESFTDGGSDSQTQSKADNSVVISSGDEEASYSEAFNLLKEGQHEASIESFKAFIKQYPDSNYVDNAQYWVGEAYYARRQFEPAIKEYKKLLETYPDSGKVSHALLKIGYSYDELGEKAQAEDELEDLIARYPGTSAASLAQQRLDHIRSD